jgi:methylmalonyl-CoA/ethylmalonyl-CoA epimerase
MSEALVPATAVDHVGIAAASPQLALARLLDQPVGPGRDMPSGVTVGRFGPGAGLELIWERRTGSPIAGFLQQRGPGLHHVALRVDEPLEAIRERLAAAGIATTSDRVEPSSDGRPCLFLHPRSTGGVLVELVEGPPRA